MSRIARTCAAVLFLLAPVFLFAAGEPWDKPFADPKAILDAAQGVSADEAGVVVLLDEERYTFDDKGSATMQQHVVYRIANESGVENWSSIEALWSPWYQEKPQMQARVIARDGSAHELDANAVAETAAPEESLDIFSDNRVLRAPLPAVAVGSVVEQLITYKDHNPMVEAGRNGRFFFGRGVPVHQARLVLDAPEALALRLVNRTPSLEPKKESAGGRQLITFETSSLKAIDYVEWGLPFDESPRPYVAFSTGKSWQEVARRYDEIVNTQIAGSSSVLSPLVKGAVAGSAKRAEVVARILATIQKDVRYAGVELGEGSVIPRPPQEVLAHKYGDCKDKATLLAAMLREAGLPAHVALLRAGEDLDVSNDLPGFGEFNHAIVMIDADKAGDKPLWIDPTDEFARPGELPVMDQGRHALVASTKTTSLIETPVADSAQNRIVETRTFNLVEEGKAAVTEVTQSEGADDAYARRFYAQSDRKRYRDAMESYAKGHYLAKELKDVSAGDPHDLSKPFALKLDIAEAGRGPTENGEAVVAIFPIALLENLPWPLRNPASEDDDEKATARNKYRKREHDFVIPVPYTKEWRYTIVPPAGFAARPLPANETSKVGTGTMTKQYALAADGSVQVTMKFESGKRRLSPAEFETTRKAIRELSDQKAVLVGFDAAGEAKLSAGDIGGALSEFRKLTKVHEKEARHHTDVARALLAGGMGDAARAEIKKAIEVEPGYGRGYFIQGLILEHDLFGRRFRKGFDRAGALAALKKARELAPKDQQIDIRAELARLDQVGDEGTMFGSGNDLAAAIEEYRSIAADLKDDRFEGDLMLALAHAGRFAEMRELAAKAKDADQRDLGTVVAAAALEGTPAALHALERLDQNQRKKIIESAGGTLATLRLYPQAADLLEQAAQSSAKATELRGQVDLLRKAKKIDAASISDADAKGVVQKLFADVFLTSDLHALGKYFASDLQPVLSYEPDDDNKPTASLSSLKVSLGRDSMPIPFVIDMTFAGIQFQQEGDDATGYRVRLRNQTAEGSDTMYVVKDGGKYRISGYNRLPELIGWRALRFAEKGETEKARRWLNWEREDLTAGNGDDPLAGPPFARLWSKGKQTATVDEIKVAAASLMLRAPFLTESLPLLVSARESLTGDAQLAVDSALAIAYSGNRDWAKLEPVARHLVAGKPDSLFAFDMLTNALSEEDKTSEADKLADERLSKLPNDPDALRTLAQTALHAGNYSRSEQWYRKLIDATTANAGDYNNAAWNALFLGISSLDRALEDARRATALPNSGPAALHTLATLYAETGKTVEAREALLRSMDDAGRDDPAPHDWYVLGRIAEAYGASDAASAAYNKVEKPKDTLNGSTWVLAQKRLKGLPR
jgi:tetratricopeptide (TPR) repeat protein